MDGLTFLHNLMRLRPMPVVMVSSLTERGAEITLDALAMGAVDFLPKPTIDIAATLQDYGDELIAKIKTAARANVRALDSRRMRDTAHRERESARARRARWPQPRKMRTTDRIIAIGASTGGTEAIKEVLCHLPPDCAGRARHAAHPDGVQHLVRAAHERCEPAHSLRSAGRPAGARGPCVHRARGPSSEPGARRRALRLPARRRSAREPPQAFRGRAVPLRGQERGPERHRRPAHRHGQGWRPGPEGNARGRQPHDGPG